MIVGILLVGTIIGCSYVIYNERDKIKKLKEKHQELTHSETVEEFRKNPPAYCYDGPEYDNKTTVINHYHDTYQTNHSNDIDTAAGAFVGSMAGTMLANSLENNHSSINSNPVIVEEPNYYNSQNVSNNNDDDGSSDITYDGDSSSDSWSDSSNDSSSFDSGGSSDW